MIRFFDRKVRTQHQGPWHASLCLLLDTHPALHRTSTPCMARAPCSSRAHSTKRQLSSSMLEEQTAYQVRSWGMHTLQKGAYAKRSAPAHPQSRCKRQLLGRDTKALHSYITHLQSPGTLIPLLFPHSKAAQPAYPARASC